MGIFRDIDQRASDLTQDIEWHLSDLPLGDAARIAYKTAIKFPLWLWARSFKAVIPAIIITTCAMQGLEKVVSIINPVPSITAEEANDLTRVYNSYMAQYGAPGSMIIDQARDGFIRRTTAGSLNVLRAIPFFYSEEIGGSPLGALERVALLPLDLYTLGGTTLTAGWQDGYALSWRENGRQLCSISTVDEELLSLVDSTNGKAMPRRDVLLRYILAHENMHCWYGHLSSIEATQIENEAFRSDYLVSLNESVADMGGILSAYHNAGMAEKPLIRSLVNWVYEWRLGTEPTHDTAASVRFLRDNFDRLVAETEGMDGLEIITHLRPIALEILPTAEQYTTYRLGMEGLSNSYDGTPPVVSGVTKTVLSPFLDPYNFIAEAGSNFSGEDEFRAALSIPQFRERAEELARLYREENGGKSPHFVSFMDGEARPTIPTSPEPAPASALTTIIP
jgi:hypothetical protein